VNKKITTLFNQNKMDESLASPSANAGPTVCFWSEQSRCVFSTLILFLAMAGVLVSFYGLVGSATNLSKSPLRFHTRLVKEFYLSVEIYKNKNQTKSQRKHDRIRKKYFEDEDEQELAVDEITQTKSALVLSIIVAPLRAFFYFASLILGFKLNFEQKRKQYLIFIKLWILAAILNIVYDFSLLIWIAASNSDKETKSCFNEGLKNLMVKYNSSKKSRYILNKIHSSFKCCGWSGFDNWNENLGNRTTSNDFYSIPLSCCNPDSTKVCAFTKVPANKKTFPWLPAINQEGCSKPLVESLRKNVKFAILLTSLLSILVNLFSAVVYRYFWTNLEFVKETDDEFNKNELTPAYLLTYNPQGSPSSIETAEGLFGGGDGGGGFGFGSKSSKSPAKGLKKSKLKAGGKKMGGKGNKLAGFLKKVKK